MLRQTGQSPGDGQLMPLQNLSLIARYRRTHRLILAWMLLLWCAASAQAADPLRFVVTYAPETGIRSFTGRVLVMLGEQVNVQPRFGPNWFRPQPFFAVDVKDWKPDTDLIVDEKALGFPAPLSRLRAGTYQAQAVMDHSLQTHRIGDAPGNAYSAVVSAPLDPQKGATIRLRIDTVVPERTFQESEQVKLADIPSSLLSRFHGRPVRLQAAVILPPGYAQEKTRRYPVVYIIPGFGGDHHSARFMTNREMEAIQVVLNPDAPTGHTVFADSANNGPCGEALIQELIPYIERTYRAVGEPGARFLNGHSSGGWSSLWLQITYPDFFGGTWSTSPDPVDFRDFQRINIYAPGENMFTDRAGHPRPLARRGDQPIIYYRDFSDMEEVMGRGGQLMSFEAVFSPKGPDGKPMRLWDRKTGAIDPDVAKAWEKYDIRLVLERNWNTLGPKLKGKLHIITGEKDTFYLEGAVRLLGESLKRLGSDAVVEIHPGKDHSSILTAALRNRIRQEMMETYRRRYPENPPPPPSRQNVATLSAASLPASQPPAPVKVTLQKTTTGYRLLRDGKPYYIQGAGGGDYLEKLKEAGGNSIRTWGADNLEPLLERAHSLGLTVTIGIWLGHERHGFNYSDPKMVQEQFDRAREAVRRYRYHPALLAWSLGNEMEGRGDNPRIWRHINDLARMVKEEDPHHPTMTVVAEIGGVKLQMFNALCPDVDILGINTYGGLASLPKRLKEANFTRPYVITEFGPLGPWEVRKTAWDAPIEPTSTQKAAFYLENYQKAIAAQRDQCLGSYVFLWGSKQEATPTWFGMLLPTGDRLQTVEAMTVAWTGKQPANRAPRLIRLQTPINEKEAAPGQTFEAQVLAEDPENDPLTVRWEVRSEKIERSQGGDYEKEPPLHPDSILEAKGMRLTLRTPLKPGGYRLYVYVYDNRGNAATANVPFFVKAP